MIRAGLLAIACAVLAAGGAFPDPATDLATRNGNQTIVFAGGCFWCTEAVFEHLQGVKSVVSGYAGGTAETAHYEMVGSGKTGHAESIRVTYDPKKVSFGTLLKVFFSVAHDPTTLNRQGPDWGPQYRSAIFYSDEEQKRVAEAYIKQLDGAHLFKQPIVTQLTPLKGFYPAEDYHQDYVVHHPENPYVVTNSIPKLRKFEQTYPELFRK